MITFAWSSMSVPVFQSLIAASTARNSAASYRRRHLGDRSDPRLVCLWKMGVKSPLNMSQIATLYPIVRASRTDLSLALRRPIEKADGTMFVIEVQHTEHSVHLPGNPVPAPGR